MKNNSRTLLCMDDDRNILRSLQRLLRTENYHVLTANSCADAFEILAKEDVQVVMSDQRMPDISGTEFLSEVKKLYPDKVRVILSGYSEAGAIVDAINLAEVFRFMSKPWEDDYLKAVIKESFDRYEQRQEKQ